MNYDDFKKNYENYYKNNLKLIPKKELIIFYKYKNVIESLGMHNNLTKEKFIKVYGIINNSKEKNDENILQQNIDLISQKEEILINTLSKNIKQQFTNSIIKNVNKLNFMNKLFLYFYNFRLAFIFAGIFFIIYPVYKIYFLIDKYMNYSGIVPTSITKNFLENLTFYCIITASIIVLTIVIYFLIKYIRKKILKKADELFKKIRS